MPKHFIVYTVNQNINLSHSTNKEWELGFKKKHDGIGHPIFWVIQDFCVGEKLNKEEELYEK